MIHGGYAWLLAIAALPLLGAPLLSRSAFRRFPLAGRVVLAWGVGAVVLSVSMTALALLGWEWHAWNLGALAAGVGVALSGLVRRSVPASSDPAAARTPPVLPAVSWIVIAAASGAALVAAATSAATSADLILVWGVKGERFAAARTYDLALLGDPVMSYVNVAYPPLLPNLYAFASLAAGRFAWGAALILFPALVLALALGLADSVSGKNRRPADLPCAALLAGVLASAGGPLLVAGNGDMPLLFFEVLSMALLVGPWRFDGAIQLLAGLLIAGAATAKVEGLIFAASAIGLFLLVNRRRVRWPSAAFRIAAPPVLALGLWFAFGARTGLFRGYQGFGPLFEIHWERLGSVLATIGHRLFAIDGALAFAIPVVLLLVFRPATANGWIPAATGLASALFLVFNYLHGPGDPTEWIGWSAGRVLLSVPALCIVSIVAREDRLARSVTGDT